MTRVIHQRRKGSTPRGQRERSPLASSSGVLVLALSLFPLAAAAQQNPVADVVSQLDQVVGQLKNAEDNLSVVETQYSNRPEPTAEEARLRRFSDGEIQYLLGDYRGAAVLFYDLVSDKRFRGHERYVDALYYLSDSLYQQHNYVGARLYLRELLGLKSKHYREALTRYLEIAGRLNEFQGVEAYIHQARGTSGELPPELAYVYGKWLFKREDLPLEERLKRAQDAFAPLAENPNGNYRLQAAYFIGVSHVKLRNYDAAIEQFKKIGAAPARGERELKVKELANLSLGRLYYETGKFDEAIDRYQEIPRESEYFPDSLYEIAWTQVKKGDYAKAYNATEILDFVAENTTLEPEAKTLQAHLLLKLKRYGEATEKYNEVINRYAPVRDEIDALLTVNKDPVRYFDDLLKKNEKNLDVGSLLPPEALKWATTQQEVARAVQMVSDLEAGRRGVSESEKIAQHILTALDQRGLETFPELQEGYTRADAVDSALTHIEQSLVRLESVLVDAQLTPDERAQLAKARAEQEQLRKRFEQLPTSQRELELRRARFRERVDELDRQAFKLGYEVQSMFAVIAAMEKWLQDTKAQRTNTPEDEKAFVEKVKYEYESLAALQKDLDRVRERLSEERTSAEAAIGGEDVIRKQYQESLARIHALLQAAEAKLPADAARALEKAHEVRARANALKARVGEAKRKLRDQVAQRGQQIRETINAEQVLLAGYRQEVSDVSGDARNLVGRIAFDSFKRVRRQFYDLVLKADVGIVDVAFTRKQDKTQDIQKLSSQKDRELRALDEEFKEVLKDVD